MPGGCLWTQPQLLLVSVLPGCWQDLDFLTPQSWEPVPDNKPVSLCLSLVLFIWRTRERRARDFVSYRRPRKQVLPVLVLQIGQCRQVRGLAQGVASLEPTLASTQMFTHGADRLADPRSAAK